MLMPLSFFHNRITGVVVSGSLNPNRGPTINHLKKEALVTVMANDDPYGVIRWKSPVEITTEQKEVNSSVLLVISRHYGSFGDILVSYETYQASSVGINERAAIPGVDYFPTNGTIVMQQGVREVYVFVKVRHVSKIQFLFC